MGKKGVIFTSLFACMACGPLEDSTPVTFGTVDNKDWAAYCQSDAGGLKKEIIIDTEYWARLTEDQQTLLLLHEKGHCDYGLKHDTDLLENGCPRSVMYPVVLSSVCATEHKLYYTQQYSLEVLNAIVGSGINPN